MDLVWTGSEIHQLSEFWIELDREMCNVYPIFKDFRQFLHIATLMFKVLPSNLELYTPSFGFTCRFYKYLVDVYSVVSGLDWTGFSFWVISWIGLD